MRRKLNVKFLLVLLVGLAFLSGGLALAHHLQYQRIPYALFRQATRAEDENDFVRAHEHLTRYLSFEPNDLDAKVRLINLLTNKKFPDVDKPVTRDRAYFYMKELLAEDGQRDEIRRKFVLLAVEMYRLDDAAEQLKLLPAGAETASLWGRWYEAKDQIDAAIDSYRDAHKQDPGDAETAARLARLLRGRRWLQASAQVRASKRAADAKEADGVLNALVQASPDSWQARLARWNYHRDYWLQRRRVTEKQCELVRATLASLTSHAARDVARALELREGELDVRLAAAEAAQFDNDSDEARAHLEKALQLHRQDGRLYKAFAGLELLDEEKKATPEEKAQARDKALAWLRRGAQELKGPAQFELLWAHATLLLDTNKPSDMEETAAVINKIRQQNVSPAGSMFLQARLLKARQQWAEAVQLFERARPNLQTATELANQIDVFLAQCYEELGDPGQQYAAYKRLAERNPGSLQARLGMAQAARALGRLDEAMKLYSDAVQTPELPPGVWSDHVRLAIVKARTTRNADDWKRVEQTLESARTRNLADEVELAVLQAEVFLAREDPAKARQVLEEAKQKHPDRVESWVALASLAERRKDPVEALQLLNDADNQFKEKTSARTELRLARAAYWVERRNEKTLPELKKLADNLEPFTVRERTRLLHGLAEANYRAGGYDEAGRLWRELTAQEAYKADLRLRLVLFDLALQEGKEEELDRVLAEIRQIEGDGGTFSRHAEALKLIWTVKKNKVPATKREATLTQASTLLDRVTAARPGWSPALLARAEVETLRGHPDQAVAAYQKAWDSGDRSPLVLRQLVEALRKQGKFDEANQRLARLSREDLERADLERAAASVALLSQDTDRAISLAEKAVRDESRDFRDHLWLGGLLAASGRQEAKAEEHFRKAIALEPTAPEVWVQLVRFLASRKRTGDAERLLVVARTSIKPAELALLAEAQCYAALEMNEKARTAYDTALNARPNDAAVLADFATFRLQRQELKEAEALLRKMLGDEVKLTPEETEWAHGRLALVLATEDDFRRFKEALPHVGLRLEQDGEIAVDETLVRGDSVTMQRLAARVLATQSSWRVRDEAIKRFEDLEKRQALTTEDRFLLARLYEARGDVAKAHTQLGTLSLAPDRKPEHIVLYAQSLLTSKQIQKAEREINRLVQFHQAGALPGGVVVLLELKARWFEVRNQGDQAIALIKEHLASKDAQPQEILLLLASFGRQQRFAEAVALLEQVWKACPAEIAGGTTVALLRSHKTSEEQLNKIEANFQNALKKDEKSVALLVQLGDLYDLRGRYEKAEEQYRAALKLQPDNVMALNNLSWLLAQRTQRGDEALKLINQAIDAAGPRGELLDTRAVVYLTLGKSAPAQSDLDNALKDAPTSARWFHLARAHHLANDRTSAVKALRQANDLGLKAEQLHPVEQVAYRKLVEELPLK